MNEAARAAMEQDLMRHYFKPRYWSVVFDPAPLVELAREQWPLLPERAEALARCTEQWSESTGYGYFIDPRTSGRRRHAGGFSLLCPRQGQLVFDVDPEGAIIGVEYLAIVMRGEEEEVHEPLPALRIEYWKDRRK